MLLRHGGGPAAVALVAALVTVTVAVSVAAGVGARGAVRRVRVPVRGGVAMVVVVAGRVPAATVLMVVAAGAQFNGHQIFISTNEPIATIPSSVTTGCPKDMNSRTRGNLPGANQCSQQVSP